MKYTRNDAHVYTTLPKRFDPANGARHSRYKYPRLCFQYHVPPTHRFYFECADRIEDISHLTAVPGIGPSGVIKLAHHRGGGPIRNLEELVIQYKACKGEALTTYERDNAFYMWLKVEKRITHCRHDITLAVSTMVLKMSRPCA